MSGTVSLWYQKKDKRKKKAPAISVHINFWRHFQKDYESRNTFLDIGIMLEAATNIKELYLFVPTRVTASQISDLGKKLTDKTTLQAVFNDALAVRNAPDQKSFEAIGEDDKVIFVCHLIDRPSDLVIQNGNYGELEEGCLITLTKRVCARLAKSKKQYFRLRIRLSEKQIGSFITIDTPKDRNFLSSFQRTEIIEFKLNEQRSYPKKIVEFQNRADAGSFQINEVNYFLIRSFRNDYIASNNNFIKLRRLEETKWKNYLSDGNEEIQTDSMLIYQWKNKVGKERLKIEDFSALAKFRLSNPNVIWFVIIVLMLGVIGNVFASAAAALLEDFLHITSKQANWGLALSLGAALAIWLDSQFGNQLRSE